MNVTGLNSPTLVVGILITVIVALARPKPRNYVQVSAETVNALRHGRLDSIEPYVSEEPTQFSGFLAHTCGLAGVRSRHVDLRYLLRALQICSHLGLVSPRDAVHVYTMAAGELWCSVIAHLSFGCVRERYAISSARYHWNSTLLTLAICQVPSAPAPFLRPDAFL